MPTIFVHAGFHKTATTSFQDFCVRNREALRSQGLHYARLDFRGVEDRPNHSYVFRTAYDAAAAGDQRLRQHLLGELGRQLARSDSLLISGEVICVLRDAAKALLLQDLRRLATRLCFILLVRHPRAYFQGALQEHLKAWDGLDLYAPSDEALRTVIDHEWGSLYTKRLAFFREQLGGDELIVRRYEDAAGVPGGVVRLLVEECLGLRFPAGQYAATPRANTSLPHENLQLVCALKNLRTEANRSASNRVMEAVTRSAPRGPSRQFFAASLSHSLPPIERELAWLAHNFAIRYDPDDVAFERADPALLWSAEFVDALLGWARRQLDAQARALLADAMEFLGRREAAAGRPTSPLVRAAAALGRPGSRTATDGARAHE